MNGVSDPTRRSWLLTALALPVMHAAGSAPRPAPAARHAVAAVTRFDAATWAQLLRSGPRPAAYVFVTTVTSMCPDPFAVLHAAITESGQRVALAAVVMDAPPARVLAQAHHYTGATRLYAFDGVEAEIRHAVEPTWRDSTPYVVLIDRAGRARGVLGPPGAATLKPWLAA